MKSSLTSFDLPHALITNGSLYAMTTIRSTPLALRASFCSRNVGICFSEQVGVKAPGTATRTTFFSLNSAKGGQNSRQENEEHFGTANVPGRCVPLLASYLMGRPQLLRPALSGE